MCGETEGSWNVQLNIGRYYNCHKGDVSLNVKQQCCYVFVEDGEGVPDTFYGYYGAVITKSDCEEAVDSDDARTSVGREMTEVI